MSVDGAPWTGPAATIAQVAWMAGVWIGTSGAATIGERWTPPAGGSTLATARTLRAGAMTAFEFLCVAVEGVSVRVSCANALRDPLVP